MSRTPKYLHIYDDDKITETSVQLFLRLEEPSQSFVILSNDKSKWEQYVNGENFQLISTDDDVHSKLTSIVSNFDIIFFHPFSYVKAQFLSKYTPKKQVFVWVLWGYDLYNIADYYGKGDYFRTTTKSSGIKSKIQNYYTYKVVYKKAIQRVDVCYFLLEEDYNVLNSLMPHNAIWQSNIYPTLEYYIDHLNSFELTGDSILLGNSSTPSNKHQFVIDKLKSIDLHNRKLICPLNYGDKAYGAKIHAYGKQHFSDQFVAITDFLPLEAYMDQIRSCSHAIMPHERQQAFGTIIILLYFGCKVFLSIKSPIYNWLKSLEVSVYNVENNLEMELNQALSPESIEQNRRVLEHVLSEKTFRVNQRKIKDRCDAIWYNKQEL